MNEKEEKKELCPFEHINHMINTVAEDLHFKWKSG